MVQFRRERLGDQLRVEIADLIQQAVRDPRVGFVTVTEVRMSPDLKQKPISILPWPKHCVLKNNPGF